MSKSREVHGIWGKSDDQNNQGSPRKKWKELILSNNKKQWNSMLYTFMYIWKLLKPWFWRKNTNRSMEQNGILRVPTGI